MRDTITQKPKHPLKPSMPQTFQRVLPRPFQHVEAITAGCRVDTSQVATADRSGAMLLWRDQHESWHPSVVLRPSGAPPCTAMAHWASALWCLGEQVVWGVSLESGDALVVDDNIPPVLDMVLRGGVLIVRCARCLIVWRWDEVANQWGERQRLEFAQHYHEDPLEMTCSPCGTLVMVNRYNQYARAHAHEVFFWDLYDRQHPKHWHVRQSGQVSVAFGEDRHALWWLDLHHPELRLTRAGGEVIQSWSLPEVCHTLHVDAQFALVCGDSGQWHRVSLTDGRSDVLRLGDGARAMRCVHMDDVHCFFGDDAGGVVAINGRRDVLSAPYMPRALTLAVQPWIDGPVQCFETGQAIWVSKDGQLWRWDRSRASGAWCEAFEVPEGERIEHVAVLERFILLTTARREQHLIERRTGERIARFAWPIDQFVCVDDRLWGMMPLEDDGSAGFWLCVADLDLGTLTTIAPPDGVRQGTWLECLTACGDGLIVHAHEPDVGYQSWVYQPATRQWCAFDHPVAVTLSPREHGFWSGVTDTRGDHVLWLDHRRTGWMIRDRRVEGLPLVGQMRGAQPSRYNQRPHLSALALSSTRRLIIGVDAQTELLMVWNAQGVCLGRCDVPSWFDGHTQLFLESEGDRFLACHPTHGVALCGLQLT